jgi:hypothetical protein
VPANRAWFPAEMTLVIMTALIKLPATFDPACWNTMVNGLVADDFVDSFGVVYGTLRPMRRTEMT